MFPLSTEVKAIIVGVLLIGAFSAGWEVQGWYRDSQDKKALEDKLGQASDAITKSNQVNAASQDQSQKTQEALNSFNNNAADLHREVHDAILTKPVAVGCSNPFTPDFLRLLNASPGSPAAH